jgi:diguanylate cyclase (GGDEF)-like protein
MPARADARDVRPHRKLLALALVAIVLFGGLGAIALRWAVAIDHVWRDHERTHDVKRAALLDLRSAVGFGGLTDAFTDFVHDGDRAHIGRFVDRLEQAEDALDEYEAAGSLTATERDALATLSEMLGTYLEALGTAQAVRTAGVTDIAAILAAVDVDATPYVEALATLGRSAARETAAADARIEGRLDTARRWLLALVPAGVFVIAFGALRIRRDFRVSERELHVAERERAELVASLEVDADRRALEQRMHVAFEMARDEQAARRLVPSVLADLAVDMQATLLLADASRAHFERPEAAGACSLASPDDCPAIRAGHTLAFPDASRFDACPLLRPDAGARASTCVPVAIGGRTVGVVQVSSPAQLDAQTTAVVEGVARQAGDRIGVLRAFEQSHRQASTDALTGLLNRRSVEEAMRGVEARGDEYAVVYTDLDRFKHLNDTYGHAAGDRALRAFAHVLRTVVRPDDLVARWGGEEFVCVLMDSDASGAVRVCERVREALALLHLDGETPGFTASFGVATSTGSTFDETVRSADEALIEAKRGGRDRIQVHGTGAQP